MIFSNDFKFILNLFLIYKKMVGRVVVCLCILAKQTLLLIIHEFRNKSNPVDKRKEKTGKKGKERNQLDEQMKGEKGKRCYLLFDFIEALAGCWFLVLRLEHVVCNPGNVILLSLPLL